VSLFLTQSRPFASPSQEKQTSNFALPPEIMNKDSLHKGKMQQQLQALCGDGMLGKSSEFFLLLEGCSGPSC
jgi:hypothetical protein